MPWYLKAIMCVARIFEELFGGGFGSGRSRVFTSFGGAPSSGGFGGFGDAMETDGDGMDGMPFFSFGRGGAGGGRYATASSGSITLMLTEILFSTPQPAYLIVSTLALPPSCYSRIWLQHIDSVQL